MALKDDGTTQAAQLFAPYGAVRHSSGTMPTTYNFTGQRLDSQTGLLYYNFRYYDPVSGRFVRADTVQNNAGGMDPYAYVGDSPENKADPTGHDGSWWQTALTITAIAVVVVVVVAVVVVAAPVVVAAAATAAGVAATTVAADGAVVAGAAATTAVVGAVAETEADNVLATAAETSSTAVETDSITADASSETSSEIRTLFRGTGHVAELAVYNDSGGYTMSDAARVAYLESRYAGASVEESLQAAQTASETAHNAQLETWGSLRDYAQAHGAFGREISQFGLRSMISFTTDPNTAISFANGESVFQTTVPVENAIQQTLPGAGELEWLLLHLARVERLP